jgi:hypothetical protein
MSNHVIHVMGHWTFSEIQCSREGRGGGRGGQICLLKPSATASLSGQRQKFISLQVFAGHAELRKKKDSEQVRRAMELSNDYMESALGSNFTPEAKEAMIRLTNTFHNIARDAYVLLRRKQRHIL